MITITMAMAMARAMARAMAMLFGANILHMSYASY